MRRYTALLLLLPIGCGAPFEAIEDSPDGGSLVVDDSEPEFEPDEPFEPEPVDSAAPSVTAAPDAPDAPDAPSEPSAPSAGPSVLPDVPSAPSASVEPDPSPSGSVGPKPDKPSPTAEPVPTVTAAPEPEPLPEPEPEPTEFPEPDPDYWEGTTFRNIAHNLGSFMQSCETDADCAPGSPNIGSDYKGLDELICLHNSALGAPLCTALSNFNLSESEGPDHPQSIAPVVPVDDPTVAALAIPCWRDGYLQADRCPEALPVCTTPSPDAPYLGGSGVWWFCAADCAPGAEGSTKEPYGCVRR